MSIKNGNSFAITLLVSTCSVWLRQQIERLATHFPRRRASDETFCKAFLSSPRSFSLLEPGFEAMVALKANPKHTHKPMHITTPKPMSSSAANTSKVLIAAINPTATKATSQ